MPAHDAPDHPLAGLLRTAFAPQLESGEVDVVALPDAAAVEIQADDWTLHLEGWPVAGGFIALDDEPPSLNERRQALDAALDNQHLAGLRHANRLLDDAIVSALEGSGDEMSALLAQIITEIGDDLLAGDEDA